MLADVDAEMVVTDFRGDGNAIEVRHEHEVLRIEPWGLDGVRVRAALGRLPEYGDGVGALEEPPPGAGPQVQIAMDSARLVNGELTVEVTTSTLEAGFASLPPRVRFIRTSSGEELLAEDPEHFWWPGPHVYYGNRSGAGEIHQQFRAYSGERLYGMGQRTHGRVDHEGLAVDLIQRNAEVSIPFVLSSRGYGFLWNNPAVGRVHFADNATRGTATQSRGIGYFITAGSPTQILARYADATGHAPRLPRWRAVSGRRSCVTGARRTAGGGA